MVAQGDTPHGYPSLTGRGRRLRHSAQLCSFPCSAPQLRPLPRGLCSDTAGPHGRAHRDHPLQAIQAVTCQGGQAAAPQEAGERCGAVVAYGAVVLWSHRLPVCFEHHRGSMHAMHARSSCCSAALHRMATRKACEQDELRHLTRRRTRRWTRVRFAPVHGADSAYQQR